MIFHTSLKVLGEARDSTHGTGQSQMVEPHGPQNLSGVVAVAEAEQMGERSEGPRNTGDQENLHRFVSSVCCLHIMSTQ